MEITYLRQITKTKRLRLRVSREENGVQVISVAFTTPDNTTAVPSWTISSEWHDTSKYNLLYNNLLQKCEFSAKKEFTLAYKEALRSSRLHRPEKMPAPERPTNEDILQRIMQFSNAEK